MQKITLINFIVMQVIIIISFIAFMFYLVRILIANKYNKKFSQFVFTDNDITDKSLEAKLSNLVLYRIKGTSYLFNKLHLFKKTRLKYNKYLFINNYYLNENIDFISMRYLINVMVIFLSIIFLLFSFTYYNIIVCILTIILCNLTIDIILKRYLNYYKKLLNLEILNTIHMINSSLNVGLSIMQAVKTSASKSSPLLQAELNILYEDLNNGISIDASFSRLNDRVKTEEIMYLSTLLSILNKSGGTTQESFKILEDSYEEKISNQKSINNLIFPYRFIYNFLGFIPLGIFIYKSIINHSYFTNIFNSNYNLILMILIIVLNTLYFIMVNNLMEVHIDE